MRFTYSPGFLIYGLFRLIYYTSDKIHEIGHAKCLRKYSSIMPIFISLDSSEESITISPIFKFLLNNKNQEAIRLIATAGRKNEYENVPKLFRKLYKKGIYQDFDDFRKKEGSDSYYYHNPDKYKYKPSQELKKPQREHLYLYKSDGSLHKITYEKALRMQTIFEKIIDSKIKFNNKYRAKRIVIKRRI